MNNLNKSLREGSFCGTDLRASRQSLHDDGDQSILTASGVGQIKQHIFDSQKAEITVGEDNVRFPFDSTQMIFDLYEPHPETMKA